MLSRLLRQLLFGLLHCILTLCETFNIVCRHLKECFRPKEMLDEVQYIVHSVKEFNRKPQHLVVLVEESWLDTRELANIALWSLLAGIPYLSFYDADGTLKPKEDELFKEVERRKHGVPGLIKWTQRQNLNGYSNGHKQFTSTINILSRRDGRERITEFISDLMNQKISCSRKEEHYTAEELDPLIKLYYPNAPDPDLVTYCSPACVTRGLLPWQIRLTEFIKLEKIKILSVKNFVCVLRRYSQCNQRFGK